MKLLFVLFLFFSLGTTFLFPQETDVQKELLKRANESFGLLEENPEEAFNNAKIIEKEARLLNAKEAELKAINTKCTYYRIENDFEKMMESAELLSQKSLSYKFPFYQVIAKRFLFESYLFTGLHEKAFQQLEEAKEFIKKLDEKDSDNIIEKINFFVAYSNYYLLKEDYENQLKYIKLSGKEIEKLSDGDPKQQLLYVYYANLAMSYNTNEIRDSAKYYAKLSQSKSGKFTRGEVTFSNFTVLGDVGMHEANYKEALTYFNEAEKVNGYKNHLDIEDLYDNIIKVNKKLGREDFVALYRAKKDSIKLSVSENQNKSLHKLLSEKKENKTSRFVYLALVFLGAMVVFLFYIIRRNRMLAHQERISDQYLDKISNYPTGEDYSKLLKALKANDPAFMFYFEETFPEFSSKLLRINPEISSSETEFCALLKLKIPTKDIAKYKFVEPKTVRNRKYLIRKKLNIQKEIDIYQWFDTF